jgi:hypothetical protein
MQPMAGEGDMRICYATEPENLPSEAGSDNENPTRISWSRVKVASWDDGGPRGTIVPLADTRACTEMELNDMPTAEADDPLLRPGGQSTHSGNGNNDQQIQPQPDAPAQARPAESSRRPRAQSLPAVLHGFRSDLNVARQLTDERQSFFATTLHKDKDRPGFGKRTRHSKNQSEDHVRPRPLPVPGACFIERPEDDATAAAWLQKIEIAGEDSGDITTPVDAVQQGGDGAADSASALPKQEQSTAAASRDLPGARPGVERPRRNAIAAASQWQAPDEWGVSKPPPADDSKTATQSPPKPVPPTSPPGGQQNTRSDDTGCEWGLTRCCACCHADCCKPDCMAICNVLAGLCGLCGN